MKPLTNPHDALVQALALAITCPDSQKHRLPELQETIDALASELGGDEVLECQHQALALAEQIDAGR